MYSLATLPARHWLARHAMIRWDVMGCFALRCLRGALWLTLEGDPEDYVLQAGDAIQRPALGRVVVQSLEDAEYEVEYAPAQEAPSA